MKSLSTKWILIGSLIVVAGLFIWSTQLQKNDTSILATKGLHWHAQLHIFVDGVEQTLPGAIGRTGAHKPIHTHTEDAGRGFLHIEVPGTVRPKDVQLKRFFQIWGKRIDSFGTLNRMVVNGKPSTAYGAYVMHDKDVMNLYYTSGATATSSVK